jgi:hypothetical protein
MQANKQPCSLSLPISTPSTSNATTSANFANARCAEHTGEYHIANMHKYGLMSSLVALVPHLDCQILEHNEIGEIGQLGQLEVGSWV